MAIIQAFVDDSGNSTAHGNPVFVLAGYISTADRWEEFSKDWEIECALDPPIRNFKMAHANSFKGDFDGWTREDRDARLLKLAVIVQRHAVLRIQTYMAWEDFNDILSGQLPGIYDSPYIWLFWKLIADLSDWQEARGVNRRVDFIFDNQGTIGDEAIRWLRSMKRVMPAAAGERIGNVRHDDDQRVLPLKSADMWAWHVRRYLADGIQDQKAGRPIGPHRVLMKELMHCPAIGEFLERSDLEALKTAYLRGVADAKNGVIPTWAEDDGS